MINHVRTLLLNRNGGTAGYDAVGEEYVPPTYVARELPPHLLAAHQAFFGSNPDRLALNYRLWQIMRLLHQSELAEFVTLLDRRITYDWDDDAYFNDVFLTTVRQYDGDGEETLYVMREAEADEGIGITQFSWRVAVVGAELVCRGITPSTSEQHTTLVFSDGLSQEVILPGVDKRVRVRSTASSGTKWTVEAAARPATNLGEWLARADRQLYGTHTPRIFGELPEEPTAMFKRLYEDHYLAPLAYGALILAVAYAINALPAPRSTA